VSLLAAYLTALAAITFWPTPVDRQAAGLIQRALAKLHTWGAPSWVNYGMVEWLANVALFVPFGLLVAWMLPRGRAWLAVPLAFAASAVIELGQLAFLSERFATPMDVLANTLGAAAGFIAAAAWRDARSPSV
jgi:glycopeptide antibiotics resistance protein